MLCCLFAVHLVCWYLFSLCCCAECCVWVIVLCMFSLYITLLLFDCALWVYWLSTLWLDWSVDLYYYGLF